MRGQFGEELDVNFATRYSKIYKALFVVPTLDLKKKNDWLVLVFDIIFKSPSN